MASKSTPDKSHLVTSYPDSAFPLGFQVAATHCGVKKKPGVLDLGILVNTSETSCSAAACFTRNVFKAAPVQVSDEVLKKNGGKVKGFIVNSGCANAVTGAKGMEDAKSMSKGVTDSLKSSEQEGGALVMSTGVIGQHLPIEKIMSSIPSLTSSLSSSSNAWLSLAKAFMTTDTFPKLRARSFKLGNETVKIVGIDKGAGMIHPNMGPPHATLLGVIATDASISPKALQSALTHAVDRSFNSITVDGDMSTNDTILCLANGASKGKEITEEATPELFDTFKKELTGFAEELAQLVVRDGEGATKFVTIRVEVSRFLSVLYIRIA
jgi:glutamate N-acetyltransferase/amino-acid N-acetyltransferase